MNVTKMSRRKLLGEVLQALDINHFIYNGALNLQLTIYGIHETHLKKNMYNVDEIN